MTELSFQISNPNIIGLAETFILPDEEPTLELNELWSFVLKKASKRWIWIALCRQTRQVVAFVIGDRLEATCQRMWEKIPEAFRLGHCFSDFWEAYQSGNHAQTTLGAIVRKTLSFLKSDVMHESCLFLFLHR